MASTHTVVGLDIGSYAVKAVWARRARGGLRVMRAEKLRIPLGVGNAAALVDPWLAKLNLGKTPCVLGVPGRQAMFHPLILPPEDPRTPEQAASMEVIRFNEMASDAMVYRFSAGELQPGERLTLLTMARPAILDGLLEFGAKRRLNIENLIPDPAAFYHALRIESESPTLYVNLGHANTDIAIGAGSLLLFARSFGVGGQRFTEAISEACDVTFGKAEDLKLTGGSLNAETDWAAPLATAAEEWIEELLSCLAVYENAMAERDMRPATLILGGGGGQLPGLAELTAKRLDMSLQPTPPLPLAADQKNDASFAVACGLAAAGLECAGAHALGLLPPDVRDERVFRKQKPFWIAAGLTAGLILAVSIAGGMRDIRRKTEYFNTVKEQLHIRDGLARQSEAVRAEQDRLRELSKPVFKFLRAGPQMRDLITLAANSLAPTDQIVMVCDADSFFGLSSDAESHSQPTPSRRGFRRRRLPTPTAAAEPLAPTFERVIIEGYTRTPNLITVRDLISRLREADFVESADLLGDDVLQKGKPAEIVQPARHARNFVIEVKLVPL